MPFRVELDIRHSGGLARRPVPLPVQGIARQVLEFGHAQVGDGDEVGGSPESPP